MRSSRILALACTLWAASLAAQTKDNLGKEFFVAFGPNQGTDENSNLFALYISSPSPATGYVEVPALSFKKDFTTTPGTITTISLPGGRNGGATVEVRTNETVVTGMAVHIVADTDISIYGMSHKQYSSDAFMAMPVDVLGLEYRIISYPASSYAAIVPSEFWIAAAFDSTTVTITPSDRFASGKVQGEVHSFLINRGDVYVVTGSTTSGNDLTQTLVQSDKPIAVFSGHERTEIPSGARHLDPATGSTMSSTSRDHLVEQLPPVSTWGDSVIVVPFASTGGPDLVRIIAAYNNTELSIGGIKQATLNAGDKYEITELSTPTSIVATKSILTAQMMHTSKYGFRTGTTVIDSAHPPYADPCMTIVYPVEQFATSYTFVSVVDPEAFNGNYINIVARVREIIAIKLDGVLLPDSAFHLVPGGRFRYAQIPVTQGTHTIAGTPPFGLTVYGMGPFDSYAYTGCTRGIVVPASVTEGNTKIEGFTLGHPYPDPSSAVKSVTIPYESSRSFNIEYKLYDELGIIRYTSETFTIPQGNASLTIDGELVRTPGVYLIEVTVHDAKANAHGRYITKFTVH